MEKLEKEMPQIYENILKIAADTSELKQFMDNSDHLHIIVRKLEIRD